VNTSTRSIAVRVVTLTAAVLVLAILTSAAGAPSASAADIVPVSGLWCGLTDDGGSIQMAVSPDARFVNDVEVRTTKGSVSAREGGPLIGAQVKSGKYILRQNTPTLRCDRGADPGRPDRCRQAPCVPAGCVQIDNLTLIRGTFEAADSLRGSFTFTISPTYRPKRVTGQYTAWPASVAPCP
jgi:hypothetical protein